MTQALIWGQDVIAQAIKLKEVVEASRVLQARYIADTTLATQYSAAAGSRSDITASDIVNFISQASPVGAVQAILNVYDTGSPTNKSLIFKIL